jgi:hypothetical protein
VVYWAFRPVPSFPGDNDCIPLETCQDGKVW